MFLLKLLLCLLLIVTLLSARAQQVGNPLPEWQEGMLDLHHINTGRGDAAFYIFPDGTTMLLDAGEMDPTDPRTTSARNSTLHPNDSKTPAEWIVFYIGNKFPKNLKPKLDYALITHFHDDHYGSVYPGAKTSVQGKYILTGITGVGDKLPIGMLIDRGYPDYKYTLDMNRFKAVVTEKPQLQQDYNSMLNYMAFTNYHVQQSGMKAATLQAGRNDQIKLVHNPGKYQDFKVQNIKANGIIWKGSGTETFNYLEKAPVEKIPENQLSLAIRIAYGDFRYYTGGDNPSVADLGAPEWMDVGTPIAKAVGEVDVAVMDHHGNRDAHNEFNIKTLRPRVWIEQTWSSDHPGHEVLRRVTSKYLYPEERDLFATNMLEANKLVIGPSLENSYKSTDGHILVRVLPGGKQYYVIILNDETEQAEVKAVFGPYQTKKK
jgi:beta-lactamase superfamily II metal-dependent hydrolase